MRGSESSSEASAWSAAEAASSFATVKSSASLALLFFALLCAVAVAGASLWVEHFEDLLRCERFGEFLGVLLLHIEALLHGGYLFFLTCEVLLDSGLSLFGGEFLVCAFVLALP